MISYNKLFMLLASRGMKKTDLLEIISAPTLAKLSKREVVKTDIIEKICMFLNCQPGDIMEYTNEEELKKKAQHFDNIQSAAIEELKAQGFTQEQLEKLLSEAINDYMEKVFTGGSPMLDIVLDELKKNENN